jgi:hypothetical protein
MLNRISTIPDESPLLKAKLSGTPLMHMNPSISTKPLKLVKNVLGGVTINDILSIRHVVEPFGAT